MIRFVRLAMLPIVLLAALTTNTASALAQAPKVGQPAPDFTLTLVDGRKVTLADLKGQVVVLNFWATWCVPCRAELPLLDAYYKQDKRFGLRVFAVTTENSVPESKLHELFGLLTIEPIHKLKGPYSYINNGVPSNYVIDRNGVVRYAAAGGFNIALLNQVLVPLLEEPQPPGAKVAMGN